MNNVVPIAQAALLSESDPKPETEITFDNFWSLFPRKDAKKPAREIWSRLSFSEQRDAIIGIATWRRHLLRKDPEFVPMAKTWLYQARWEDELPVDVTVSAASHQAFPVDKPLPLKTELPEGVRALLRKLTGRTA